MPQAPSPQAPSPRAATTRYYASRIIGVAVCFVIGAAIVGLVLALLIEDRAFWQADRFVVAAIAGALFGWFEARRGLRRRPGSTAAPGSSSPAG